MLKIETYLKYFIEIKIEEKPNTKPIIYGRSKIDVLLVNRKDSCWLSQKEYKNEQKTEKPVVKDHRPLASKFRGLAHDKCTIIT